MKRLLYPFLLALIISIAGCDGSSFTFSTYSGVWDVRYNLVLDECQVVLPTVPGFVDQHSIDDSNGLITFSAVSGFAADVTTERQIDDSFSASQSFSGDLFGDGSFCQITSTFEYYDPGENRASSLFLQIIACNDGFSCRSEGVGTAERQIS